MALKHEGVLKDIRKGHGSEREHDFTSSNPSNKFDTEAVEPRSADQLRRVRTMGDGSELRTGKLDNPKSPPAPPKGSANPGPQKRRVH